MNEISSIHPQTNNKIGNDWKDTILAFGISLANLDAITRQTVEDWLHLARLVNLALQQDQVSSGLKAHDLQDVYTPSIIDKSFGGNQDSNNMATIHSNRDGDPESNDILQAFPKKEADDGPVDPNHSFQSILEAGDHNDIAGFRGRDTVTDEIANLSDNSNRQIPLNIPVESAINSFSELIKYLQESNAALNTLVDSLNLGIVQITAWNSMLSDSEDNIEKFNNIISDLVPSLESLAEVESGLTIVLDEHIDFLHEDNLALKDNITWLSGFSEQLKKFSEIRLGESKKDEGAELIKKVKEDAVSHIALDLGGKFLTGAGITAAAEGAATAAGVGIAELAGEGIAALAIANPVGLAVAGAIGVGLLGYYAYQQFSKNEKPPAQNNVDQVIATERKENQPGITGIANVPQLQNEVGIVNKNDWWAPDINSLINSSPVTQSNSHPATHRDASNQINSGGKKQITININQPLYKVDNQIFQSVSDSLRDFEPKVREALLRILESANASM